MITTLAVTAVLTCGPATVTRVVDGDTFDAQVQLLNIQYGMRVRILHMNAPEMHAKDPEEQLLAVKAKAYLTDKLTHAKIITVCTMDQDDFGRWLGSVVVDSVNVADDMIAHGLAKPYDPKGGKK